MVAADTIALTLIAAVVVVVAGWWLSWQVVNLGWSYSRRLAGRLRHLGAWAYQHPLRARLAQRFPRTYGAVAARLDPRVFTGLPLTLMAAAAAYLAGLFGGLVDELWESPRLIAFDELVNQALQPWRTPVLIFVFEWLTDLGASAALLGVAFVATGFLWADGRSHFIPGLWLAFLGSQFTTWIGKFAVDRGRPEFVTAITEWSPSFPSGHATGAMAVYGFIAYAVARDLPHPRHRFEVAYWTVVLILLVGFSRIFVSVHFATDVAGGFLVGGFWLLAGFALVEWRRQGK